MLILDSKSVAVNGFEFVVESVAGGRFKVTVLQNNQLVTEHTGTKDEFDLPSEVKRAMLSLDHTLRDWFLVEVEDEAGEHWTVIADENPDGWKVAWAGIMSYGTEIVEGGLEAVLSFINEKFGANL